MVEERLPLSNNKLDYDLCLSMIIIGF